MATYREPLPDDPADIEPVFIAEMPADLAAHYRQRDTETRRPRWYNESTSSVQLAVTARGLVMMARILKRLEDR